MCATLILYIHCIENISVSSNFRHLFRHPRRNLLTITIPSPHSSPLPPGTRPWYVLSLHSSRTYIECHFQYIHNHGQSYNNANTNSSASQHWSYIDHAPGTSAQRQQHRPSVSASAAFGNQSMYSPREVNVGSQPIGRAGVSAAVSNHIL